MGHSRTPTQNTAGDGFTDNPVAGYVRALIGNRAWWPGRAGETRAPVPQPQEETAR